MLEGRWHDALKYARWYPFEFLYQLLAWCEKEFPDLALGALVGAFALVGLTGSTTRRPGAYLLLAVLIAAPILKGLAAPEPPLVVHEGSISFTCWRSSSWLPSSASSNCGGSSGQPG